VVTTTIEHPCVLGAMEVIERDGAEVVRVAPERDGVVRVEAVLAAMTSDTLLCSVMAVNNETGVVQPAGELARACTSRGVLLHCDAVQAFGRLPTSLRELPVDLLSFSAHKLGGPAGVGVLFDRRAVDVEALTPGHQENGRRGGTQSVAFAEAAAMALEHAVATADEFSSRVTLLRDAFEREVLARLTGVTVNGAGVARVGNTSNLTFDGVDGEALLIALDLAGICVSTGAACASGSVSPSHVLLAMGLTSSRAHSTLRFSLGPDANQAQVDEVVAALVRLAPGCRE
jgi:cysteine desulfurase